MSRSTASLASSVTRVERYERSIRSSGNLDLDVNENEKGTPKDARFSQLSQLTARDTSRDARFSQLSQMTAKDSPSSPLPTLGETSSDHAASKTGPPGPPAPPGPAGLGGPPGPNGLYQPKSLKFWLTLVANFLAMFLVALDRTILSTAIPTITDEFHSLGDIGWYGSAYMLTTACSQLIFGRLYKHYNMKW